MALFDLAPELLATYRAPQPAPTDFDPSGPPRWRRPARMT